MGLVYLPTRMVDFYGKLVGKYTVFPMDGMDGVRVTKCKDPPSTYKWFRKNMFFSGFHWHYVTPTYKWSYFCPIFFELLNWVSSCPPHGRVSNSSLRIDLFLSVASRMHETSEGPNVTGPVRWDGTHWSHEGEGFAMKIWMFPLIVAPPNRPF